MAKTKYAVDANNRLLISRPGGAKKNFPVPGRFVLDKNNLAYNLNAPEAWRRELNLPQQIRFSGNWTLDPNHNLALSLRETQHRSRGNTLTLNGELSGFRSEAILFGLTTRAKSGRELTRILKLAGRWQADKHNHLTFLVKKKEAPADVLTLRGIWQVNKNNRLTYDYEKTRLKTKRKEKRSILFQGFWEISSKDRLTYILDLDKESYFALRTQLETPNLTGKKGEIKYRVGIGVEKKRRPYMQTVSLFGTWRFGRKGDISFDIDYGGGRHKAVTFGTQFYLTRRDKIVVELSNEKGEDLGVSVSFNKRFLKLETKAFLGLKRRGGESRVNGGFGLSW